MGVGEIQLPTCELGPSSEPDDRREQVLGLARNGTNGRHGILAFRNELRQLSGMHLLRHHDHGAVFVLLIPPLASTFTAGLATSITSSESARRGARSSELHSGE